MMYKWVLMFLMLPAIAWGQIEEPSAGALTDQSVKGDHIDSTSEDFAFDGAYHKTTAEADSAYMSKKYIDDSAGGLVAQSVKGDHVDSTAEDFVFDDPFKGTSAEPDSELATLYYVRSEAGDSAQAYDDFSEIGGSVIDGQVPNDITIDHATETDSAGKALFAQQDADGDSVDISSLATIASPTFTTDIETPLVIGGTETTSDLSLKTTSGVGETGADMHFLVGNNGGTEAMTILNNGNVGIGINSPSSIFHIKADVPGTVGSHPAGQLIIQNPINSVFGCAVITGYESDAVGNPDQQLWYLGSSSSSNSNIIFLNRRNSKLELGTNGVSRMTIDGGGYVGIGTASPPERLSVVGNIATGDTAAGDVDVFHYFSTDGSWVTEYLKWDDGVGRFEISDDFDIGGNLTLSGTATLGTIAGAIDAGGATSFEIPAVDNPTTDAEGEIAWDTNDDAIEVYSGDEGESGLIPFYRHISVALLLPDSVQTYTPDLFIFHVNALMYPHGIEIDLVSIQLEADAAYSMLIEEWTGADPPVYQNAVSTVTTGASDTYAEEAPDNDGNLDAGDWLVLDIPTTDVDVVTVEIFFHVTEGN